MRNKFIFFLVLLLCGLNASYGQTLSEIERSYGKQTEAYSVSEHIWMKPEFAVNGQVCHMRLYPKPVSGNTNRDSKQLPFDDFRNVVDQIIPLDKRGAKVEPFIGGGTGGGVVWDTFKYEKIRITYSATFTIDADAWKNEKPFNFSEQFALLPEKDETSTKPEDDFAVYKNSKTELVVITWLDRKCVGK